MLQIPFRCEAHTVGGDTMRPGSITKGDIYQLGEHFAMDIMVQIDRYLCTLLTKIFLPLSRHL